MAIPREELRRGGVRDDVAIPRERGSVGGKVGRHFHFVAPIHAKEDACVYFSHLQAIERADRDGIISHGRGHCAGRTTTRAHPHEVRIAH